MIQQLTPDSIKEVVRRHWDGRAATFDNAPNHGLHSDEQTAAWLERIGRWAGSTAVDALDVGCGTGFLMLQLARLGHRATGVDVADEMLARARAKAEEVGLAVELQKADAERLPFPDASFDLLVERHVIWTLPEPAVALAEWSRVLRPGGQLILIEGSWRGPNSRGHADYEPIRDALPLFGGRPPEVLTKYATESGLGEITVEPLMESVLWGETVPPERERYALRAYKPGL
jgi:ubiquinone/menaquinone biosynthesis C-methylase UbiE